MNDKSQGIYDRLVKRTRCILELQAETSRISSRLDEIKKIQLAMDKEAEDDQKLLEKIT